MRALAWLCKTLLLGGLAVWGCDGASRPDAASDSDDLALHLAPRVGFGRALTKLAVRDERVLVGLSAPLSPESDEQPLYELLSWNARSDALVPVHSAARAGALGADAAFVIDAEQRLLKLDASGSRVLLDRVRGAPCPLADGSVVASRLVEPGNTDLWHVSAAGAAPLAPAEGPDDLPIALGDGRVAFVSGRTTVASLWVVDLATGTASQLTNRGLVAGKPRPGFVPPPRQVLSVSDRELVYDAGHGERWRVELASGTARRSAP